MLDKMKSSLTMGGAGGSLNFADRIGLLITGRGLFGNI
jgi:hypothetical protein